MKRNRKIFFKKIHKYTGGSFGEYLAASDGYIIHQIYKICNKYKDIQITSIKIEDNLFDSDYIKIKAHKEDFNNFCIDFCEALMDCIEDIKF